MAITKLDTIARMLDIPTSTVVADSGDSRILHAQGKTYLAISEKYELTKACKEWVAQNAWRVPVSFILPFSEDQHHGFYGIRSAALTRALEEMQRDLGEDFNELVMSIIQNKTAFVNSVVEHFGYAFVFGSIDGEVLSQNGFMIIRTK